MIAMTTLGKDIEDLLEDIFRLFPEDVKFKELNQNYHRYLLELSTILRFTKDIKGDKILDLGTGGGVIPLVLKKYGADVSCVDTWEAHSSDLDIFKVGDANTVVDRLRNNGIKTIRCDIEKDKLPFEDDTFDFVWMLAVIEHLHASPKDILREIHRVLKRGGHLILSTPNMATLKNRIFVLFGKSNYVPIDFWFNKTPFYGHVREYTIEEIKWMLEMCDFNIKHKELSNCLQIPTRVKNNKDFHYDREFRINSYERLVMLGYLAFTALMPNLRYYMIVVGTKK
jgi:SAM-dependent methyltransferase